MTVSLHDVGYSNSRQAKPHKHPHAPLMTEYTLAPVFFAAIRMDHFLELLAPRILRSLLRGDLFLHSTDKYMIALGPAEMSCQ